jgi:hypothetical protein
MRLCAGKLERKGRTSETITRGTMTVAWMRIDDLLGCSRRTNRTFFLVVLANPSQLFCLEK